MSAVNNCKVFQRLMYVLDLDKLQRGDILLTATRSSVSKGIRKFTGSDYSHAMLYVENSSYIHADQAGVHSGNSQRLLFEKSEYVKVLRVVENKADNYSDSACGYARGEVGKAYSVKDALSTKNPLSRKKRSNRQFCSRMVAQSYDYAGLKLVKDPQFCTPQDLDDSPQTQEVLNCLRVASPEEIMFAQSDSPIEKQTEITNNLLKELRLLAGVDIQTFSQAIEAIQNNPTLDTQASAILKKSGYLTFWHLDVEKNPWRYDYETFISLPFSRSKMISVAGSELERAKKTKDRHLPSYQYYTSMYKKTDLLFVLLMRDLYGMLVGIQVKCIDVYSKILNTQ